MPPPDKILESFRIQTKNGMGPKDPLIRERGELFSIVLAFAFIFGVALWSLTLPSLQPKTDLASSAVTSSTARTIGEFLPLEAKAAYVYDIRDKEVVYSKNAEMQLPLASLTKLVVAGVVEENMSLSSSVNIPPAIAARSEENILKAGERWEIRELLDYTLVISSNDGAKALAAAYNAGLGRQETASLSKKDFIEEMNDFSRNLGMKQSYFLNETGVDQTSSLSGAYGSAKDIAILLEYLIKKDPGILAPTTESAVGFTTLDHSRHVAINTNTSLSSLPRTIASKTGFTDLAGGNLAVVIDAGINHPVAIVVLGSSKEGRLNDVNLLAWKTVDLMAQP